MAFMIPNVAGSGGFPLQNINPINPRILLLHQLLGGNNAPSEPIHGLPGHNVGPTGGAPHGFGPGGAVTGTNGAPGVYPNHIGLPPGFGSGGSIHGVLPGGGHGVHAALAGALAQEIAGGGPHGNIPMPVYSTGHVDQGYNPAQVARANGNTGQAVADWEAHHPAAMASGNIPGWVSDFMAGQARSAIGGAHIGHVAQAHEAAHQLAQMIARQRGGRGLRRKLRAVMPPPVTPAAPSGFQNTAY